MPTLARDLKIPFFANYVQCNCKRKSSSKTGNNKNTDSIVMCVFYWLRLNSIHSSVVQRVFSVSSS